MGEQTNMGDFRLTDQEPTACTEVRNELLMEFPKEKCEGLNLNRVEDYIQSQGLLLGNYILFEESDLAKIGEIIGRIGLDTSHLFMIDSNEVYCSGVYVPIIDLAFIRRDNNLEKTNGPIYTESVVVHELAHASAVVNQYVVKGKEYGVPSSGFVQPNEINSKNNWGQFLEEGFAELLQAEYYAANISQLEKDRLIDNQVYYAPLGMDILAEDRSARGVTWIPIKYRRLDAQGRPTFSVSSPCGYGLELICRQYPALRDLIVQSRKSNKAISQIAQTLNNINPGLYTMLQTGQKLSESSAISFKNDFDEKLTYLINLFGGQRAQLDYMRKSKEVIERKKLRLG